MSLVPAQAIAARSDSDLKLDPSITVSGLEAGDTARYYQIIDQNSTADAKYVKAKAFEADVTYYTRSGETYAKANVTSDTFTAGEHYKLLPQNDWKFTTAVDKNQDGVIDGSNPALYIEDFVIKNTTEDPKDGKKITAAMANAICTALSSNNANAVTTQKTVDDNASSVTWTGTDPEHPFPAGLFMVEASAGAKNSDYVYKPIFVSTDYFKDGNNQDKDSTDSIALVANPAGAGQTATDYDGGTNHVGEGVFKKSTVKIEKISGKTSGNNTDTQRDVAVGDVVDFTVKVPVPTYTTNYEHPFYMVTDRLSEGLELCTADGTTGETVSAKDITAKLMNGDADVSDDQIVKKVNAAKNLYTVVVSEDLLRSVTNVPTLVITYKAKVNSPALYQVNQMDNKAVVTFSNDPNTAGPSPTDPGDPEKPNPNYPDPTDPSKRWDPTKPPSSQNDNPPGGTSNKGDRTRHYTFGIDANVLKPDNNVPDPDNPDSTVPAEKHDETKELEKVGIEANGKVDDTTTAAKYPSGDADSSTDVKQSFNPLSGATFELRTGSAQKGTALKFTKGVQDPTSDNKTLTSAPDGSITARGLDAGTYYLVETGCPLGYTYDPSLYYTIVITPSYVEDAEGNEILASYDVTITNSKTGKVATSTYTVAMDGAGSNAKPVSFLNESGTLNDTISTFITLTNSGDDTITILANKKLGLLPATGGSGMLFYLAIGTGIMVVAVLLARAKRRSENTTLA